MRTKLKLRSMALTFLLTLAMVVGLMPGMSMTAHATTYSGQVDSLQANDILEPGASFSASGGTIILQEGGWCTQTDEGGYAPGNGNNSFKDSNCKVSSGEDSTGAIADNVGTLCYPYFSGEKVDSWKVVSITGDEWDDLAITLTGYKETQSNTPFPTAVSYRQYDSTGTQMADGTLAANAGFQIESDTKKWAGGNTYVASGEVTIDSRIKVTGTVNLILLDGATLTASKGITVSNEDTLNIYGQTNGTGKLTITGTDNYNAAIGGINRESGGTVNIHGGTVTAIGGAGSNPVGGGAAGIGGGGGDEGSSGGGGGTVNIYGGTVTAIGGSSTEGGGAGIGGGGGGNSSSGGRGGTVNIYGGTVTATGGNSGNGGSAAAGIGGGVRGDSNGSNGAAGTLTLGTGVLMSVSTDNSDWSAYDGSTRARYMKTGSASVAVTGVTLAPSAEQTISVGEKVSFTASVSPDNATDKKVKWSVGGTDAGAVKLYSDEACTIEVGTAATETLTVYAKGTSAGSATVTATSNADSEKKASCDVTVTSLSKLTLNVGENGKVVMGSGIYGKGSASGVNVTKDIDLTGKVNCSEDYFINVQEGASLNIQTGGEISFYPASDNSGAITAVPADGYAFAGWYNGETLYSENAKLEYQKISENLNLTAIFKAVKYSVTVNPGSNMTKTTDSGAASQTDLSGAMTDVVYTADDGYYFPKNYSVDAVNGISVTRNSYTQITVSGTPSNNTEITLISPTAKAVPTTDDFHYSDQGSIEYDGLPKSAYVEPDATRGVVGMGEITVHYYSDAGCKEDVASPTNAGTYYVGITVAEGDEYSAVSSVLHDTSWQFAITRAMPITENFTFSAPSDLTYDGNAKAATVLPASGVTGMGGVTVKYYSDEECTKEVQSPTNVGTYYVGIQVEEGTNYSATSSDLHDASWKFTITKAAQTITASDVTATYGDIDKKISASTSGDGAISYAAKEESGDYIGVAADGTLTIKKVPADGNAYVVVTAAETGNYAEAAKDLKVTISKKDVTVGGITASNKPYDGNTTATLDTSKATFTGKLDGDTLTVTATGTFADESVGDNKTVTISDLTLSGDNAGNYKLASEGQQTTATASITPNTLNIVATEYTGTYDGQPHSISVTTEEDGVTITYAESEDGDYILANPTYTNAGVHTVYYKAEKTGSTTVSGAKNVMISQKAVTVSGITANDKTYNGNTNATLVTTKAAFEGKLEPDTLTVSAAGSFDNANAGENKTVTISDLTLGGAGKDNYKLATNGQQTTTTAKITAKEVGLEWSNTEMAYTGEAQMPIATATGLVEGDTCTVTVTGEQTNAGDNYTATAESLSNSNYKLPENKTTAFKISKAASLVKISTKAKTLTYNEKAQELVTAGEAKGGEMQYALGADAAKAPQDGWSTSIPTATDAGTYYVWYKVVGDENHNDTEPACVSVTINDPAATPAAAAVTSITVNTKTVNAKKLNAAVAKAGGSNEYVTTIVLGKKVKKISKSTFKNYPNAKTLVVKTKKLKRASVKKSLKGSKITKVKVKVSSKKKINKKYVRKYKKIFTKKNAGKKVKVSR